jgi:hypothetical protein
MALVELQSLPLPTYDIRDVAQAALSAYNLVAGLRCNEEQVKA